MKMFPLILFSCVFLLLLTPLIPAKQLASISVNPYSMEKTGEYKIYSQTGYEALYDVVFYGKQNKDGVTEYQICLESNFSFKEILNDKDEVIDIYDVPLTMVNYKDGALQPVLNRDLEKSELNFLPIFEQGDKFMFCTDYLNPFKVSNIQIGSSTAIIISEEDAFVDAWLMNITAEAGDSNHSHLTASSIIPYDSLVGYWSFDGDKPDTTGVTAYDWSDIDNDGTYVGNTITNSTFGLYGQGAKFDGADDYITVDDSPSFTSGVGQGLALVAWTYLASDTQTDEEIFYKYDSTTKDGFYLSFDTGTNKWEFVVFENPSYDLINSNAVVTAGKWVHLVGQRNTTGGMEMYVDGVKQNELGLMTGEVDSTDPLYIGTRPALDRDWNGSLDELMIFNASLTAAQIVAIYNNQSARFKTQGTQLQKSFNLTGDGTGLGANKVNMSINFSAEYVGNNKGTNLSARACYWDITKGYNDSTAILTSDDVQAWWHFDEPFFDLSSGGVKDATGNYNGTSGGNANTTTANSTYGNIGIFDGDNDYIDTIGNGDWDLIGDFGVMLWAKPVSTDADGRLFGAYGSDYWAIVQEDSGTGLWQWYCSEAASECIVSSNSPPTGGWQHIAVTRTSGTTNMYIDGILQADSDYEPDVIGTADSPWIGTGEGGTTDYNGSIDEIMFFNRTVTARDVMEIYTTQRASFECSEYQNLTGSEINTSFSIDNESTRFCPEFLFNEDNASFYTPILFGDQVYDFYDEGAAPPSDTSFTVSLPAQTETGVFRGSNQSAGNLSVDNQTTDIPFLNITNTGDVNLEINISLNTSLPENFWLLADDDNDPDGSTSITADEHVIIASISAGGNKGIWLWTTWINQLPMEFTKQLNVSVREV